MAIDLNFIEQGSGPALVLVPGWSQTARGFRQQLDGLSDDYRVIAIDQRGHGDSPKPRSGYRIARLAADLHDFLVTHALDRIALAGHSMGCSVIWSYLEQFGADRIAKLIFIDQAPLVTNWFGLSGDALADSGAAFAPEALAATANALIDDQAGTLDGLRGAFFSDAVSDADVAWNKAESLTMDGAHAARLLIDHGSQDWRDVISEILPALELPTLVIAGEHETIFPVASARWIAAQIPGAQLSVFTREQGGSHFMFWENPALFNAVVREFLRS